MFIKNHDCPLAIILASIFFKRSLVFIVYSTILKDILMQIKKQGIKYDFYDLNKLYGSIHLSSIDRRLVDIYNDMNSYLINKEHSDFNYICALDANQRLGEARLYDLPTTKNYHTSDSTILMWHRIAMDVYESISGKYNEKRTIEKIIRDYFFPQIGKGLKYYPSRNEYWEVIDSFSIYAQLKGIESYSDSEFEEFFDIELRSDFFGINIHKDDGQIISVGYLVPFLITESKAMTKIITDALDFEIPDYQLEDFPEKERIITALEIGYVLLKYVPVIREDFSDIILPKLLSSLCLDENDNAAERISTRLKQLKDTFQAQTLLTDDISQYLQTL